MANILNPKAIEDPQAQFKSNLIASSSPLEGNIQPIAVMTSRKARKLTEDNLKRLNRLTGKSFTI